MKVSWSHCVLKVHDMDTMIAFYSDTLGFRVADRGPLAPGSDTEIVFLSGSSSDHHQIAFMNTRTDEPGGSLDHNAFRVDSIGDVKSVIARVEDDERVGSGFPLSHGNAVSVYFSDPEGNGIEVFCDTPWHVQQPQAKSWDPSLSDEEVLAWIEQEFSTEPGFGPMDDYRSAQAAAFGEDG